MLERHAKYGKWMKSDRSAAGSGIESNLYFEKHNKTWKVWEREGIPSNL
jgi:uncharacterized lipoprotein NlpE involved in copper resistance